MAILIKITWKEFKKIIEILERYKLRVVTLDYKEDFWFNKMLALFSQTKKQPRNILVENLSQKDFNRLVLVIDMWNAIKNFSKDKERLPYDEECEIISSKLQRAYFKQFNEKVFPND